MIEIFYPSFLEFFFAILAIYIIYLFYKFMILIPYNYKKNKLKNKKTIQNEKNDKI